MKVKPYVFGLRAFGALGYGELYLLTFGQRTEPVCIDCTVVNENVTAAFLGDEAKALGFVEPLHVAGFGIGHRSFLSY